MAIENTMQFKGVYHVLGGLISPMDGIGPSELRIEELVEKGGLFSPQGPSGSFWIFHPNLVHASSANLSPFGRTIITQCYAHVDNAISTPSRPEWVAHTDFTAISALHEDCLV